MKDKSTDEEQDETKEKEDDESDPKIEDYLSFGNAWKQINKKVPKEFFSPMNDIEFSSKLQYGITVACSLGIAYIAELDRQGTQLVDVRAITKDLDKYIKNPADIALAIEEETLNLQSLITEDQVEMELEIIMMQPNFNARVDVALDYLMDHLSVDDQVQRILLKNSIEPVFHKLGLLIPNFYKPYTPPTPKRNGAHHPLVQTGQKIIN